MGPQTHNAALEESVLTVIYDELVELARSGPEACGERSPLRLLAQCSELGLQRREVSTDHLVRLGSQSDLFQRRDLYHPPERK